MEFYGCPAIPVRQPVTTPSVVSTPAAAATLPGFTIYFDYDRSSLDGAGFSNLNEVVRLLKADATLNVVLKGHTDMKGSVEANYKLSLVRSKVCADYLASYGIDRNRIKLEAYSKLQPAADPAEDRLQWKNRRVEVVLEH
jgi:OmpA-OmpF porin, OOP family